MAAKELEIKVRGKKCLEVMPKAKIGYGTFFCEEYHFIVFNVDDMTDDMRELYNKILELILKGEEE